MARAVKDQRLHRLHRGVYAAGHPVLTAEGRWLAAVLAVGERAVLSHRSAARLWGLPVKEGREVDVIGLRGRRPLKGITVHSSRALGDDEITTRRRIAVTTLPRTIADLADVLTERELSRAVHEAEVLHRVSQRALDRAAESARGRRGCGRLRRTVGGERDVTRSALERRFLSLCRRHGLPRPEVNVEIAGSSATSPGGHSGSRWRPTGGPTTTRGARSNATASATSSLRVPASSRCASRIARSSRIPRASRRRSAPRSPRPARRPGRSARARRSAGGRSRRRSRAGW